MSNAVSDCGVIIITSGCTVSDSGLYRVAGASLIEHALAAANELGSDQTAVITDIGAKISRREGVVHIASDSIALGIKEALEHIKCSNVMIMWADSILVKPSIISGMVGVLDGSFGDKEPVAAVVLNGYSEEQQEQMVALGAADLDNNALDNSIALVSHTRIISNITDDIISNEGQINMHTLVLAIIGRGLQAYCMYVSGECAAKASHRPDLVLFEFRYQASIRAKLVYSGVIVRAPETVFFGFGIKIEPGAIIHPYVVLGSNVVIESGAEIKSFSHIENAHIGRGAVIGPFAHISESTVIGESSVVGNFAEVKRSNIGRDVKMKHACYVGDAAIGDGSNIGAGLVICNYDGVKKHSTTIGNKCFLGSNSSLCAPIAIGDGAFIGAGSVIRRNVAKNMLAVARANQCNIENGGLELLNGDLNKKTKRSEDALSKDQEEGQEDERAHKGRRRYAAGLTPKSERPTRLRGEEGGGYRTKRESDGGYRARSSGRGASRDERYSDRKQRFERDGNSFGRAARSERSDDKRAPRRSDGRNSEKRISSFNREPGRRSERRDFTTAGHKPGGARRNKTADNKSD